MPRAKKLDTNDIEVGQTGTREFSSTGPAVISDIEIQKVDGPALKEKAEILKFMEEPVTIEIPESTDKNSRLIVELFVNGVPQRIIRGKPQTVKRKYVALLASAKPISYTSQEYQDLNGVRSTRYPSRTGLRYPFRVVEDKNPKGSDWLRKVLAEA